MSTRSLICEELDNGKYKTIYCHSDGYLEWNGALLLDFYNSKQKVEELLNLGDISILYPLLYPDPRFPHGFDYNERQENVVVAYGRDRGETGVEAKKYSYDQITADDTMIAFVYIFDKNNEWQVLKHPFKEMKPLKQALDESYKRMGIKRPPNFFGYLNEDEIKRIKKKQSEETM